MELTTRELQEKLNRLQEATMKEEVKNTAKNMRITNYLLVGLIFAVLLAPFLG